MFAALHAFVLGAAQPTQVEEQFEQAIPERAQRLVVVVATRAMASVELGRQGRPAPRVVGPLLGGAQSFAAVSGAG